MKILIIRFSSIGDIILTEPISYVLQKKFPDAEIDYLTKKNYIPLIKSFREIENIYHKNCKEIFRNKYDIILDLQSKLNSYLISFRLKALKKLHYNKKHLLRLLIVKKLTNSSIDTVLTLYFSPLKKLYIAYEKQKPVLIPKKSKKVDELFDNLKNNRKLIAIFPGAKHNTKKYPKEYFVQFILINKNRYNFVLLGSIEEENLSNFISNKTGNIHNLTGFFNLSELIYFISKVDIVISNDSGPMHIAAALSKPQIAIFGSTHPNLGFAPLNEKAIILQKNLPCRPCHIHGRKSCPLKHFRCMKDISPYELSKAVKKLIEKYFQGNKNEG